MKSTGNDSAGLTAGTPYYQCVKAANDPSRGTRLNKADFSAS